MFLTFVHNINIWALFHLGLLVLGTPQKLTSLIATMNESKGAMTCREMGLKVGELDDMHFFLDASIEIELKHAFGNQGREFSFVSL